MTSIRSRKPLIYCLIIIKSLILENKTMFTIASVLEIVGASFGDLRAWVAKKENRDA